MNYNMNQAAGPQVSNLYGTPMQNPISQRPSGYGQDLQIPSQLPGLQVSKSMNFTSKKARRQNWFSQFKQNKKLETEFLLKGFDLRKESKSFLLSLKTLTQIPMKDVTSSSEDGQNQKPPVPQAKYYLIYYLTLFNKDIGTNGNFYGLTYHGKPIALKEVNGYWESSSEEYVYFHTNYTDKTSFAAVECVIMRDHQNLKQYASLGYSLCTIFEFKGLSTVELLKGSPRSIGQVGIESVSANQRRQGAPIKLTFEMRDFPAFDKLQKLIPMNCFCGTNDVIPGLVNDVVPNPRGPSGNLGQVQLQLQPINTIYIHNIQMNCSIALENRFENFLRKMKLEKLKTTRGNQAAATSTSQKNDNVYINERRIIVCANNAWKNVSEDTYVSMGAPNESGISQSGGSLTIKNFIFNPMIALLFRVEYKAVLPSDKYNEQVYFTLGWFCHLPSFNAAGELSDETIEEEFLLGPGQAPSGELLWDPNADDINYYQIKIKATISTNSQAPHVGSDSFAGKKTLGTPGQLGAGPPINNRGGQQLSQKDLQIQAEQDKRMKQIQDQLELAQRQANEMQRRTEQLEIERLNNRQQSQYPGNYDPYSGGNGGYNTGGQGAIDPRIEEQLRIQQLQKEQLQNQVMQMQNEMKGYLDSVKDAGQFQQQRQYANQEAFNRQIQQPLSVDSAQQVAMIGNVFYNMLNMIGDQEKDKRIIGLSDNIKKMVQHQKFDDLLAPKVPLVGATGINLLKTTDLPLSDQINFIKMGFGDMLQHPTAQVTSSSIVKERLSLESERQDPLRSSTITIKFICLKTPWEGLDRLPSKFYFQLKFFTFPSILTDKVKIKSANDGDQVIRPGQTYYLSKETNYYNPQQNRQSISSSSNRDTMSDPNLLSLVFEIDPSVSRIKDENMKLAQYLRERFLTVDIFDGDSLFLYGSCKIPLFEILRQGRGSVVRAKECEMCDPQTGDFKGALQLIIGNQGKMQSVSEELINKQEAQAQQEFSPQKSRLQPSQSAGQEKKMKKVVKSRPMDLTKMQETNNQMNVISASNATHLGQSTDNFHKSIVSQVQNSQVQYASVNNADLRKKLRVDRVRKLTMGNQGGSVGGGGQGALGSAVDDPSQPDWAKFKSLREIEMIRETKKDQIISNVLNEYVSGVQQLSIIPGLLEFFSVKIHNPFNQNEVFSIHINDPDEHLLVERELQVVTDQMEWRHWVTMGKSSKPFAWDCLTKGGDIILKPNDEVEILFKYLTLREASINQNEQPSAEIIKKRKVQVIILQSNRQPYHTVDLTIIPSSSPIDHTFRFYEPQNSHVTILVPPFVQLNQPGLTALLSRPTATVEIQKETSIIQVETKTDSAPQISEITLYLYGDQYKEILLATCKIEIYSLVTLYTKIKAGVQSTQTLALPAEQPRTVQVHASEPRCVYLPQRALNQSFKLLPQTINHIQICAKTFAAVQKRVRIHCTDVNSGELVYAWLMIIDSEKPTITKKHDVVCKVNAPSIQSLEFSNKLNLRTVFEFASSRPDLAIPKQEAITFEGRESKLVDLHFGPQPKYGTADVLLYISDLDQNICECHLLRVAYIP